jgi:hypothetical protein
VTAYGLAHVVLTATWQSGDPTITTTTTTTTTTATATATATAH